MDLFRRGNEFSDQGEFERALECFEKAVAICPSFAGAHCNLGLALQYLGRIDESIPALQRSLVASYEAPVTHMNLAMSLFS